MSDTIVDFTDEEAVARVASPLGRRVGTPEDIAGAVLYLSSRAGAWLTGVTIPVGGGRGTVDS
jgi:NAD(P)-dependent dehydrogenase (short-subunit alcohol dehydrogenase family)